MARRLSQEQFITAATVKHGAKYDYSQTKYKTSHDKVTIVCPLHGSFTQKACAHLNYGCRQCGNIQSTDKRRDDVASYTERAKKIHLDKYDYKLVSFQTQHQKIDIICPLHGIFQQLANDHLKGRGCAQCGSEASGSKRRGIYQTTTEEFIEKASGLHGDRYEYKDAVYHGSLASVTIGCKVHGVFQQSPYNHLKGLGCLKCRIEGRTSSGCGKRGSSPMLFDEFYRRATEIHGGRYDYRYYSALNAPVGIECELHGLFMQDGRDHIYARSGCPSCAQAQRAELGKYTEEEYERCLVEKWDGKITLVTGYQGLCSPAGFNCMAHGDFVAIAAQILSSKHGCPQCWQAVRGLSMRYTQGEFEALAASAHANKYQYGAYDGTDKKIRVECPKHGQFYQNAGNHLAGMGCPTCAVRKTQMQNKWLDSMGVKDREIWLKLPSGTRIKADGYDASTNTIYEFWGDYWHGNPQIYQPDQINPATGKSYGFLYQKTLSKRKAITDQGFNLIEIWEHDWKKINGKTS